MGRTRALTVTRVGLGWVGYLPANGKFELCDLIFIDLSLMHEVLTNL